MTDVARRARERDMDVSADPATRVAAYRSLLRTDRVCDNCKGAKIMIVLSLRRGSGAPRRPCSDCHGSGYELRWRFELAAYAGDPVARASLGDRVLGAAAEGGTVDFELWVTGFRRWGEAFFVAAKAAGVPPLFPEWMGSPPEVIDWEYAARPRITAAVTAYALDAAALRQREG